MPNNRLQHTPKGARTRPPGLLRRDVEPTLARRLNGRRLFPAAGRSALRAAQPAAGAYGPAASRLASGPRLSRRPLGPKEEMKETVQRKFGVGWPILLTVTCLLGILIYGSGHDWKSANFLFWPYLPMYAVLWCLCYTLLGAALGLAGRRLKICSPWLPWVIIPIVGLIPRSRQAAWALMHWKYYSYLLIPLGIGFASFLVFAFLGYALSRRITLSSRTTGFAIAAVSVSLLLTESRVVVDYLSTRGTFLRYGSHWDDWRHGQSLPSNWETAEANGIRFILRDHFIGHNKCHGYFFLPTGTVVPKEGPWGQIRDTRAMPEGWYEFLSN